MPTPLPYVDTLASIGLSPEQASIYASLLANGPQTASQLATSAKIKRTYVYNLCQQLSLQGLINRRPYGKSTLFEAANPDRLHEIASSQEKSAQLASQSLDHLLPSLKADFRRHEVKPIIGYFEGPAGLQKIYDDIIASGQELILFRSIHDSTTAELDKMVDRQIQRQVQAGIHVRTITPFEAKYTRYTFLMLDQARLVDRHIINSHELALPSQILIYGTKVALISLKSQIMATVIDNPDISLTFRILFDYMWQASQAEHNQITSQWSDPGPNPYS